MIAVAVMRHIALADDLIEAYCDVVSAAMGAAEDAYEQYCALLSHSPREVAERLAASIGLDLDDPETAQA